MTDSSDETDSPKEQSRVTKEDRRSMESRGSVLLDVQAAFENAFSDDDDDVDDKSTSEIHSDDSSNENKKKELPKFPSGIDIRMLESIHSNMPEVNNFALTARIGLGNNSPSQGEEEKKEWKMGEPLHDDTLVLGRLRNAFGKFINHMAAQVILSIFNIINAIILGILVYPCEEDSNRCRVLEGMDFSILIIFTVELAMQVFYLGPITFFTHGWVVFDFVIILMSWVFLDSSASVFRSLRIFRLFALFSRFESLRNLVKAVGKTLPKMATIWLSLMLFFYTFAVLFTVRD